MPRRRAFPSGNLFAEHSTSRLNKIFTCIAPKSGRTGRHT
ncbi:Uncharacterized protein pbN1_31140 [Aromatoleum bremense]|nr:Uncharacterized protein pbN1_31140 [Aromatoleum bremense]